MKLETGWDSETIFQEARRITIAEYQHIIYNEFLPPLVGKRPLQKYIKVFWAILGPPLSE